MTYVNWKVSTDNHTHIVMVLVVHVHVVLYCICTSFDISTHVFSLLQEERKKLRELSRRKYEVSQIITAHNTFLLV